ncbi:hypothetical protein [Paenibacillus sp. H1-7]|nr:hypothetical protein [Paenibacillus sp. H1-7]
MTSVVPLYETPYSFSGEIRKVVFVTSSPQLDAPAAAELELVTE